MKSSTLAQLASEIDLLVFRISSPESSLDRDLVLSQAMIVQEIIEKEHTQKIQSILKRRNKNKK